MFSYSERLKSFDCWPKEYEYFAKRLAVMGQYSIETSELKTRCLYCGVESSSWDLGKNAFMSHFTPSSRCTIYKLSTKASRREMCRDRTVPTKAAIKLDELTEKFVEKGFIRLNIFGSFNFLCVKCGSTDLSHQCPNLRVQKVFESMDLSSAQFYIKYFNGEFLSEIDTMRETKFSITNEQKSLLTGLFKECVKKSAFQSLEDYLKECSETIYTEIEKRMKKIEKDAFDSMYTDSMML